MTKHPLGLIPYLGAWITPNDFPIYLNGWWFNARVRDGEIILLHRI